MQPATHIKQDDHVRHPSRGVGIVATVITSPLSGKAVKAWVEFPVRSWRQKFLCFADDLTVVAPKPVPPPKLTVIGPSAPMAVA